MSKLSSVFFYFQWDCGHLDLHSFPTRRSSDLGEMRVELLGACRACKSSKTTLVDLIERTTRHWIPEVTAVKDVSRVASLYQRVAEDAMAEAENGPSAAELLLNMETPKNSKESDRKSVV